MLISQIELCIGINRKGRVRKYADSVLTMMVINRRHIYIACATHVCPIFAHTCA